MNTRDFTRGRKEPGKKMVQRCFPSVGSVMLCVCRSASPKGNGVISLKKIMIMRGSVGEAVN